MSDVIKEPRVTVYDSDHTERLERVRDDLMGDMSAGELGELQLKVDALVKIAMLSGEHHHDSTGGVGHHDHSSLADLSWRLERPGVIMDSVIKGKK